MKRIAVLASGSGTNLQAIIDAVDDGTITGAQVTQLISDREDALLWNVPGSIISPPCSLTENYAGREEFDGAIIAALQAQQIDLVILAGYMRLITPDFVAAFPQRILNIHPSLLPAFPGTQGVADALAYGVKVTGCTVHFVDEGMDTGPIILQEAIPVNDHDTRETLHQRIQVLEHKLYPQAIKLWLEGRLKIEGRRCLIDDN